MPSFVKKKTTGLRRWSCLPRSGSAVVLHRVGEVFDRLELVAGDVSGGSAVWKLLQYGVSPEELGEDELRDIVSFACAAAGLSATRPGGISSIPEYDEVLQALKQ